MKENTNIPFYQVKSPEEIPEYPHGPVCPAPSTQEYEKAALERKRLVIIYQSWRN